MRGERRKIGGAPVREVMQIDGTAEAVSERLLHLFSRPILARISDDSRGSVEIVLAEVLNNICEHAYAEDSGRIELTISLHDGFVFVQTVDSGLPMPGGELPSGKLAAAGTTEEVPEGGFGWFLIRSMTQDLTYLREGERNLLSFCIAVDNQV